MTIRPEIQKITTESSGRGYSTKLYKGVSKNGFPSDYDGVIVLAPGWLGSGTLHFAASHLARHGHDVAVVNHSKTSLFHPNSDRSRNVHLTAKSASVATGKKKVILAGHSLGNRDVHSASIEALKRQTKYPEDEDLYRIDAIGAIAGVGLSGKLLNGSNLVKELAGIAHDLHDHPIEELNIVGKSFANIIKHPKYPLLRTVEGLGAIVCDVRPKASLFIKGSMLRNYTEVYFDNDRVIPLPDDRADYLMMQGSHVSPIVNGDLITEIARKLYEPNRPQNLYLADHGVAA
jgi:pimeloyl-ACP methyl ester carboxylesterase